jgi:hypothetical protein
MRNGVTFSVVLCMLALAPLSQCQDPAPQPPSQEPPQASDAAMFSPDQLDNLLAQVALYPDPLLAQLLVAATFPDQIDEAARFVRADSIPADIDGQSWDVSVKAIAHYPTVLYMMADQLDWTTALGQAYVSQADDVMASVERLRAEAQAAGNLQSDGQMQVVDDGGDIEIWPEQPQYIYVPEYDPVVIYTGYRGLSWGSGYPIGAWLNVDIDWHTHRVYYFGWQDGKPWAATTLPFIKPTGPYVNERFRTIAVDRSVVSRNVNYNNLGRYDGVHQNVSYSNVRAGNPEGGSAGVNNKIIERNVNTNDSRINDYRGHVMAQPERQGEPSPSPQPRPEAVRPQPPAPSAFSGNQGGFSARESSQRGQSSRQEMQRSAPAPRPAPAPRSAPSAPASRGGGKR